MLDKLIAQPSCNFHSYIHKTPTQMKITNIVASKKIDINQLKRIISLIDHLNMKVLEV